MDEHRATKTSAEVHDTGSGEASTGPEEAVKPPDLERRTLLASVLAVTATSLVATVRAAAVAADQDSFIAVSKILTGQTTLDPGQATRLYDALLADNPEF